MQANITIHNSPKKTNLSGYSARAKRIAFFTTLTVTLFALGALAIRWTFALFHSQQYSLAAMAMGGALALYIIGGTTLKQCEFHILRRGSAQRVRAYGYNNNLLYLAKWALGKRDDLARPARREWVYVQRDNGTVGEVYLTDLYKCLLADAGEGSILKQEKWVGRIDREYLDDIRAVVVQAGVVRRKGNGALVALHTPGYTLELVTRHFYE